MATITLAVPDDLKREMEQFKEMNWSEVARSAIKEKISQLSILKSITSKSKLTDQDALDLGKKINKSLHARYQEAS
jgi:hypothetical protein